MGWNKNTVKGSVTMSWMYAIVSRRTDRYGVRWLIDGKEYEPLTDKNLSHVLRLYGTEGWELAAKDDDNSYIFKKKVTEEDFE
jgi:hypothetical protein